MLLMPICLIFNVTDNNLTSFEVERLEDGSEGNLIYLLIVVEELLHLIPEDSAASER